jgi:hypothetical protein
VPELVRQGGAALARRDSVRPNGGSLDEIEMLRSLAESDDVEREATWIQWPRLLSAMLHRACEVALVNARVPKTDPAWSALEYLVARRKHFERRPDLYPIGQGPIELLLQRVLRREVTLEAACEAAREPDVAGAVSLLYLRSLALIARGLLKADKWAELTVLQLITLAAADTLPDVPEARPVRADVVLMTCSAAQRALLEAPDDFVYRTASTAARALLSATTDPEEQARLLHGLGTLHVDPYTVGRPSDAYQVAIDVWMRRSLPFRHPGPLVRSLADRGMPEPLEALQTACEYLRRAAALREGVDRGRSLKALACALAPLIKVLDHAEHANEFCQIASEAHALLAADPDPRGVLALRDMCTWVGCANCPDVVEPALPGLELLKRSLPGESQELVLRIVGSSRRPASELLAWLGDVESIFERSAFENVWLKLQDQRLRLLCAAEAFELESCETREDLLRSLDEWERRVAQQGADRHRLAVEATRLARASSRLDFDHVGVRLTDYIVQLSPAWVARCGEAMLALRAILLSGAGSLAYAGRNWDAAADFQLRALAAFDRIGLPEAATRAVGLAADVVTRFKPSMATLSAFNLLPWVARFETRLGAKAAKSLRTIFTTTLELLGTGSDDMALRLLSGCKGARFGAALRAAPTLHRLPANHERKLTLIQELQDELAGLDAMSLLYPATAHIDEESLLASPTGDEQLLPGHTEVERLRNLFVDFDRELNQSLAIASEPADSPGGLDSTQRQRLLDDRTVLVDLFWDSERGRLYAGLSTSSETRYAICEHRQHTFILKVDGAVTFDATSLLVRGVRQSIVRDPGCEPVDIEATGWLEELQKMIFDDIWPELETWRSQGKDHLCVVPHGALHYCPLHLALKDGVPLAERWRVSVLPNLGLLMRDRRAEPARSEAMRALAVSFADTELALPNAASEGTAIASIFGGVPLCDEAVSEAAIVAALKSARYVHLATHGRHNVAAASFQELLTGDGESLCAHELIGQDLRGLEVISLAACETGLGRFDASDSLGGLPAVLLLAGTESLIGTLWPVESEAAQTFFTSFYEQLHTGATRIDSFAAAQYHTRTRFPAYRDW